MELAEMMARLEAPGTEQNRKVYGKHGAKEPLFGVSFGNLDKPRKEIKTNDALAEQLWNTGKYGCPDAGRHDRRSENPNA